MNRVARAALAFFVFWLFFTCASAAARDRLKISSTTSIVYSEVEGIIEGVSNISEAIQSAFSRLASGASLARDVVGRAAEKAFRAFEAGLGATSSLRTAMADQPSVPFDRLGLLALGIAAVAGCVAIAARRYWYSEFWTPECWDLLARTERLEALTCGSEQPGLREGRRFWDPIPDARVSRVPGKDLEYVRMLIRLGCYRDAERALEAIRVRVGIASIPADN